MNTIYRIITYNVLQGWADTSLRGRTLLSGAQRRDAAYSWLARQGPAVVSMQELDRVTVSQLAKDAARWGHGYSALLECGCNIGVTARTAIDVIEKKLDMHHGLLHVRVDGIEVLATHFTPYADCLEERRREISIVTERVQAAARARQPCVVLGDLNALSPGDDDLIGPASMAWYPTEWPLVDGRPDYSTLRELLNSGLVDPWVQHRAVDTAVFPERPRYDYTLLSTDLAAHSVDAHFWQNEETGAWSDHWPIGVDLAWPSEPAR